MNTFEPGRIYSGLYEGARVLLVRQDADVWVWREIDGSGCYGETGVTDIRGPLVVLDDSRNTPMDAVAVVLREAGFDHLAHQVEEQTRPPLQDGWHEVENPRWIGRTVRELRDGKWYTVPGHRDVMQDWTSTHYIGPGSDRS